MRKVYPHFIRLGEVHILRNIFLIYNSTESQINKVEVVKVESYSRNMKARDHRETKVHKEYKSDQVSHQLIITLVQHGAAEALFPLAIWLGAQVTSPAISLSLIPSLAASSGSAAEMSHRSPGQDSELRVQWSQGHIMPGSVSTLYRRGGSCFVRGAEPRHHVSGLSPSERLLPRVHTCAL